MLHPPHAEAIIRRRSNTSRRLALFSRRPCAPWGPFGSARKLGQLCQPKSIFFDERKFVQKAHRFAQPINRSPWAIRGIETWRNLRLTDVEKVKIVRDSIVFKLQENLCETELTSVWVNEVSNKIAFVCVCVRLHFFLKVYYYFVIWIFFFGAISLSNFSQIKKGGVLSPKKFCNIYLYNK